MTHPFKDRPPREKMYSDETEAICRIMKSRGDQRIGQLLLNAVSQTVGIEPPEDPDDIEEVQDHWMSVRQR